MNKEHIFDKKDNYNLIDDFISTRERLNKIVMDRADIVIKRFYSLDSQTYREGVLKSKVKEMLGLVSSLVLRCDDCIKYHLNQCFNENISTSEIVEVMSVGLVVGGSIVIPHLRRAFEFWTALEKDRFDKIIISIKEKIEDINLNSNILDKEKKEEILNFVCKICSEKIPYYNWFGFYLTSDKDDNILELGPFLGEPTEHVRIPFGKGICGQAAEKKETFIVNDISEEANYLACSLKVKSELVTPIIRNGKVLGEIDIDSHFLNSFSDMDKDFNEELAKLIEPFI